MKLTVAIAGALLLQAAPSAADEFCDVIVRVTRDAGNSFVNVRGVSHHPSGKRYEEVPTPPDTFPERIVHNRDDIPPDKDTPQPCTIFAPLVGQPRWHYVCEFPVPAWHKGVPDAKAIADHVVSCLVVANQNFVTEKPPAGDYFRASTDEAIITIGIDIPSDAGEPRYYMFIDQKVR